MNRLTPLLWTALAGVVLTLLICHADCFELCHKDTPWHQPKGHKGHSHGPVCVTGPRLPLTTFPSVYAAQRYAVSSRQSLVLLHKGQCNCPFTGCPHNHEWHRQRIY